MSWLDQLFPGGVVTQYGPADANEGLSGGYNATEPGIDIALPVGTPVRAPYGGKVVENTGNEVVIQFGRVLEDLMHIRGGPQVGTQVAAGQQVGTISDADISPDAQKRVWFGSHWYSSSGAHVEAGFYPVGVTPGDPSVGQSFDANTYLAAAGVGQAAPPAGGGHATFGGSPPVAPPPPKPSGGNTSIPVLSGLGSAAGNAAYDVTHVQDVPGHVAGQVGKEMSKEVSKTAAAVMAFVARLALTALFGIGALLIGLMLLDRLTGSNTMGKVAGAAKLAAL